MSEKQPLSEAQVWDDSALQAIWNASVKEYQKYHSINARGEDIVQVLKAAAEAEAQTAEAEAMLRNGNGDVNGDGEEMQADDELGEGDDEKEEYVPADPGTTTETNAGQMNGLPMPQAMIAQSTHDEKLKNLMMSWYWAGYYTGFYEGQQSHSTSNGT